MADHSYISGDFFPLHKRNTEEIDVKVKVDE